MARKKNTDLKHERVYVFADTSDLLKGSLADVNTDELPDDAKIPVEVPIFRGGKFDHPFYGTLDFDYEYLNRIVHNHNKKIVQRGIPIDEDHRRYYGGAVAWVREDIPNPLEIRLSTVPTPGGAPRQVPVLYAKMYLNRKGAQIVKQQIYRYFSAEIDPDYSTDELVPISSLSPGEGHHAVKVDEDRDLAITHHGPCLVGGGFTNNPYIPGLGEIMFSDTCGETENGTKLMFNRSPSYELGYQFDFFGYAPVDEEVASNEVNNDKPEPEDVQGSSKNERPGFGEVDIPAQSFDGEANMKDLLEKLAAAGSRAERIKILEAGNQTFSADSSEAATIAAMLKIERDAQDTEQAFANVTAEAQKFKLEAMELRNANVSLKIEAQKAKEVAYDNRVKLFCEKLAAAGHTPAITKTVENVLLNSPVENRETRYSFSQEDGSNSELDLMGVIEKVLDQVPVAGRVSFNSELDAGASAGEVEVVPPGLNEPETEQFSDASQDEGDEDVETPEQVIARRVAKFTEKYNRTLDESLWSHIDDDGELQWREVPVETTQGE